MQKDYHIFLIAFSLFQSLSANSFLELLISNPLGVWSCTPLFPSYLLSNFYLGHSYISTLFIYHYLHRSFLPTFILSNPYLD